MNTKTVVAVFKGRYIVFETEFSPLKFHTHIYNMHSGRIWRDAVDSFASSRESSEQEWI